MEGREGGRGKERRVVVRWGRWRGRETVVVVEMGVEVGEVCEGGEVGMEAGVRWWRW